MSQQAKRYAKRDALWQARSLLRTTLSLFPGTAPELLSKPSPEERPRLRMISLARGRLDETRIDAEDLRRVRHALKRLGSLPPNALRRLSREPVTWLSRVEHLCDLFGLRLGGQTVSINQLAQVCDQRVRAQLHSMLDERPELSTLLSTILQVELTRRDGLDATRWKFLQTHLDSMADLVSAEDDLRLQLGLYQIAPSIEPRWFQFLIEVLGCPELSEESNSLLPRFTQLANQLRKRLQFGVSVDTPARPRLRSELITHTRWLVRQPPKHIRVCTRFLASLIADSTIKDIQDVFGGVENAIRNIERAHAKVTALGPIEYIVAVGGDVPINKLLEAPQEAVSMVESIALLRKQLSEMTVRNELPTFKGKTRFFESLSGAHWRVRLGWLQVCKRHTPRYDPSNPNQIHRLLPALGNLFQRRGVPARVQLSVSCDEIVSALDDEPVSPEQLSRYLAVVERILYGTPTLAFHGATAASAALFARSRSEAVTLVEWHAARGNSSTNLYHLEYAIPLSKNVQEAFELLGWFSEIRLCHETLELLTGVEDPLLRRSILGMLSRREKRRIERFVTHLRLWKALGKPLEAVPRAERDACWVATYPASLHAALLELSQQCDDAETVAAQLLRQNFPSRGRLQSQVEFLTQKLGEDDLTSVQRDRMTAKRDRLLGYLNAPPAPSDARLKKLESKIRARCERAAVEEFQQRCRASALQPFGGDDVIDSLPDRLQKPPYNELLPAVLSLGGRARTVGLRLLMAGDRERKNLAPLEPANARFLTKMRRLGIQMEPWLNANQVVSDKSGNLHLGFEDDALELLLMGHHFSTCLSPHDVNFFSAVSNAIDINKQVLYCKTEGGRVVGRCLFALTDAGFIQTFNRYCHLVELPFDMLVDSFAQNLAHRMGTGLTATGTVSNLVSKDWYDDGPIQGGLSRIFDGERTLEVVLKQATPSTLEQDLCAFFEGRASVVANLSLILRQIEFVGRSKLVIPLVTSFAFDRGVTFGQRLGFAIRAWGDDRNDVAQRLFDQEPARRLLPRLRRFIEDPNELGEREREEAVVGLLMQRDLRIAHQFLISTRAKHVKRDEDETSPFRRRSLAEIHRQRGRWESARRLSENAH
ncbi:MAG: hypothetical protein AAFX06_18025 [Planctomycetota bacterium]